MINIEWFILFDRIQGLKIYVKKFTENLNGCK